MSRIDEGIIQEIRDRVNIVEVVGQYVVLKRSGANYQGLCPFHGEKTPSFNVNEPRQIFHCFGCGVGGNAFSFLMRMEGLAFPEAVKRLGEKVGVTVEDTPETPAERQRRDTFDRLVRINEAAAAFYQQLLLEGDAGAGARRYLRQRGYEAETVRAFLLGFAPEQWESLARHLAQQGYTPGELRESGLVREGKQDRGDYDLFRNRLLFPIHDLQGRVVAFGGRVLDDSLPKYINSPESPVYHKGRVLYGLHQAREAMRQSGEALVVEGYFDVMALHRAGFANAVATCGTALTPDHARLLKRYAEQVLLVFDEDAAGRQATFRAMDVLLPEGLVVKVVGLSAGEDPDSLVKKSGAEGFRACLDRARPVIEVFLEDQLQQHGPSVEGRARAAQEVLARIKRLPDELARNLYIKRVAELTGLDEGLLLGRSRPIAPAQRSPAAPAPPAPSAPGGTPARGRAAAPPSAAARSQAILLKLMTMNRGVREQVRADGVATLFFDALPRGLAEHLLAIDGGDDTLPEARMFDGLDESQQALLSGLLLQDDDAWTEDAGRIFSDCQRSVKHAVLRERLRELDRLEAAAEQSGDEEAGNRCKQERLRINAEIKKRL